MKIVCDNCATKYSIADEKVRGKVFKIRCKKCSHIIVVKGGEGAAADALPAASDSAESPAAEPAADGWHVVINGEQVGPLSPAEIRGKVQGGEIDGETYAWREGFGDWQKLSTIDDFRDLVPAAAAPPEATKRSNADDLFGGGGDAGARGGDLFGAPAGDLFAGGAQPAPQQGGGLFAQQAEPAPAPSPRRSPTPGFGAPAMAASEAAPVESSKAMTGQRSENSVLFSLNNLQALASGGGGAKATNGGPSGVDNRAGFANSQTEGSGLIDIRAMAAATLSSSSSPSESRSGDIPSFSSAPVFSPIAAPILMPSAPSGPPRWIWPVIVLGVLAVGSVITVGVLLLNKKPVVVAAAPVVPAVAAPGTPTTTGVTPAVTHPGAPTPAAAVPTPPPVNGTEPATAPSEHHKSSKGAAARAAKTGKVESAPVAATPAPAAPTPAPKSHKSKDELDDLLNGATGSGGGGEKPSHAAREERSAPADDNLPDQLDKSAIVSGMKRIGSKVGSCFDQFKVPGMAMVAVTIAKSGRVSSASVSGAFSGTPTGDCVARAVKSASFSPFKGAPQSINYPFNLR